MSSPDTPTAYAEQLKTEAAARTLAGWSFPPPEAGNSHSRTIKKVGVIGAGVMGSGIAHWCAACGLQVVLRDVQPDFIARGLTVIRGLFDGGVKLGQQTADEAEQAMGRIVTTTGWDGFSDCDLVIEAIVEDVAAKQKLFAEIATNVGPLVLLASNTSALPIEELFGNVPQPERTLGIHFFNPVGRMPLVELIMGRQTSEATATAALGFVKQLKKSPVICRSSPGFLVTRVLFFYLNEACRLWEEGVPTETIDNAMREWGWPMGPMRLIDEVGVDVTDFIFGEMAHYFTARFQRATICTRLLAAGFKGRKNGASSGFYAYVGREASLNEAAKLMDVGPMSSTPTATEIAGRLMAVMVAEAQRCLDEGVIKTPADVDFALLSGAGFPATRGGLMHWAAGKNTG